jgi:hypothetical protein
MRSICSIRRITRILSGGKTSMAAGIYSPRRANDHFNSATYSEHYTPPARKSAFILSADFARKPCVGRVYPRTLQNCGSATRIKPQQISTPSDCRKTSRGDGNGASAQGWAFR